VTFLENQVPPGNLYCLSLRVAGQTMFLVGDATQIDRNIGNDFGMSGLVSIMQGSVLPPPFVDGAHHQA